MEKIGIFLGFGPGQPLKNQGIGRLLAFIINGVINSEDKKIVIGIAHWYATQIQDLIADQGIDPAKIEIITTESTPWWAKLTALVANRQARLNESIETTAPIVTKPLTFKQKIIKFPIRATRKIRNIIHSEYYRWALTPQFTLRKLALGLLLLFALPFILIAMGIENLYCKIRYFLRRVKNRLPFKPTNPFANPLYWLKKSRLLYMAYHALRTREMEQLIQRINARDDIALWFVPGLFWPEIASIKAKKIAAAPDVVFVDFPNHFSSHRYYYHYTYQCMVASIRAADHFVCYSDYVKYKHLVAPFKVSADKISIIKHGTTDLQAYHDQSKSSAEIEHAAVMTLRKHQESHLRQDVYARDLDFGSLRYLFYSSQLRPYKNFLHLIKAYEILLRERFINCKLITTAELTRDKAVCRYLYEHRLEKDVLSFPHIPSKVLAAFNQLALCAVNPTLFEGGFPFTFSEAYSVGTPSVMSKIPVVTAEITDETLQKTMLFDPYDVQDMAAKIGWAINHREELLALQKPLYDNLKKRTWDIVAHDYVDLLSKYA